MKTVLVTGGTGQVGRALGMRAPRFAEADFRLRMVSRPSFDFERPETVDICFRDAAPALVINTAAWTAVDLAESDEKGAARANEFGPARLARLCATANVPLLHISTDYVFDGTKGAPYLEGDAPHPLSVYGATKLAGERAVLATGAAAVILRTSGIYAPEGRNFVRTMLAAAQRNSTLRVVADQFLCPTSADDLAEAVLSMVPTIAGGVTESIGGIFHAASSGSTSWHSFAGAIFAAAGRYGWPVPTVTPITTADWPTSAPRPADSRLDSSKLERIYGVRLPEWRASIERVVAAICQNAN